MDLCYEIKKKTLIIYLGEEIDHHNAEFIRKKVDKIIEQNHIRTVLFDFENTTFMDSSGIGVIMGRYKNVKSIGGNVGVVNVSSNTDRLLRLSGIYRIIKSYKSITEAMQLLS